MANPLGNFCNQLISFFEDIAETYPEEADIAKAAQALKLLKKANPRMIHNVFMESVHAEFKEHILAENEAYILRRAHEIVHSEEHAGNADISRAFCIFDRHWSTMSETNKRAIWKHFKVLTILAEKAAVNPDSALSTP